jgi:hypothetical protein
MSLVSCLDIYGLNIAMATSYIYVIGGDAPPYKVGISKDPQRRLKNLQTGHPHKLSIHSIKETDVAKTKLLESTIHHHLKHHRTHGEWFDLPLDDIKLEVEFALMRYEDDPLLRTRVRERWF